LAGDAFAQRRGGMRRGQPARPAAAIPRASEAEKALAEANNRFAWDLYARLREESDGNLFYSPQSISIALAMTYHGARGATAAEMAKVLHLETPQEDVPAAFAALLNRMKAGGAGGSEVAAQRGYKLSLANRLWGQDGYRFLDSFLAPLAESYQAPLGRLDFARQTEAARKTINDWVANQTNDKIKDLLAPGVLDSTTRLVLTNAIYFKGTWASQFDKAVTRPAPFTISGGQQVDVPMMHQKLQANYDQNELVTVIELPYQGDAVSFIGILPTKTDGLADVERVLSPAKLTEWTASMGSPEVEVWLPKFKTTSEFVLNDVLAKLGMPKAFGSEADFSGMDGTRNLYISAAVHKAFVDVNEEGTEAAAATAVVMAERAMLRQPTFRADHPFLFVIRDNATGSILFAGRVMDPRE
jgi:serpin B